MAKMTIIEGNSNDKDQVRAYLVKGEKGYSAYELYAQNGGTLTEEEWLEEFTNADNFYNKSETDNLLNNKANSSDVYTKNETNNLLSEKANSSDVYDKTEVYTQTETDDLLNNKANSSALSYYKLKGDFAVLEGTITMPAKDSGPTSGTIEFNYPTSFNMNNCVPIAVLGGRVASSNFYATTIPYETAISQSLGVGNLYCKLQDSKVTVSIYKYQDSQASYSSKIKIVLLKYKD